MTYYEWVSYIDELKTKPITDDVIKKINTYNFDFPPEVMVRLEDHLLRVIFDKLGTIRDELDTEIDKVNSPQELTLLINKIKSTIKDVFKIQKVKSFDTALLNELKGDIERYVDDYTTTIKRRYAAVKSSDYAMILNNLNLMEER